jgi:hypothetical protein
LDSGLTIATLHFCGSLPNPLEVKGDTQVLKSHTKWWVSFVSDLSTNWRTIFRVVHCPVRRSSAWTWVPLAKEETCHLQLPPPAAPLLEMAISPALSYSAGTMPSRPRDSINDGSLPIIIHAAMRQDMELSSPADRSRIIARVASLKTRADGAAYLAEVAAKRRASIQHSLSWNKRASCT